MYSLLRNPSAKTGISLLLILFAVAICAPLLATHDPYALEPAASKLSPSTHHFLGTDYAGRDIFSRLLYSMRLAYYGGCIAISITASIGILLGTAAGYYGKWFDAAVMRIVDAWLAIPGLLFLFVVIATTGDGFYPIVLAVGLAGIPSFTRLVRGVAINETKQPYVEAARMIGVLPMRIALKHIAPNLVSPLVTYLASGFGSAILAAGSLGFIGLIENPTTPELGQLLREGREMMNHTWWPILGPILVIWLTMLATNLISDGVSEKR